MDIRTCHSGSLQDRCQVWWLLENVKKCVSFPFDIKLTGSPIGPIGPGGPFVDGTSFGTLQILWHPSKQHFCLGTQSPSDMHRPMTAIAGSHSEVSLSGTGHVPGWTIGGKTPGVKRKSKSSTGSTYFLSFLDEPTHKDPLNRFSNIIEKNTVDWGWNLYHVVKATVKLLVHL